MYLSHINLLWTTRAMLIVEITNEKRAQEPRKPHGFVEMSSLPVVSRERESPSYASAYVCFGYG